MEINKNKQCGALLIEAMLACFLGVLLIGSFIEIYLSVKKTVMLQKALIEIQENARFSAHFISQNIRLAGYADCDSSGILVNKALAIQGYQNSLPAFLAEKALKNTDSIQLGECKAKDDKTRWAPFVFFIGQTSRKTSLGKTINALYEMPIDNDKRELVAGVDDMQIQYGVTDTKGADISAYLPANQVSDWEMVKSVKIALLFSSELPVLAKAEPVEFAGKTRSADRLLHREWDFYVALRER